MSSQPRPTEHGRSSKLIAIEIVLLFGVPTLIIFIISKLWK
jgi:hypothetical protein